MPSRRSSKKDSPAKLAGRMKRRWPVVLLRNKGEILGQVDPPKDEAEHFIRCPACGGWMDCRDLGQVFEHEGPLPHPAQDRPQ